MFVYVSVPAMCQCHSLGVCHCYPIRPTQHPAAVTRCSSGCDCDDTQQMLMGWQYFGWHSEFLILIAQTKESLDLLL